MSRRQPRRPVSFGHGVTLAQRSNGRWRVRWFEPPKSRNSRDSREKTFAAGARSEAEEFARELAVSFADYGDYATTRSERRATPWVHVFERWLNAKATDWQPDIADQHERILRKWAEPILRDVPMAAIRLEDYQQVLGALARAERFGSRDRVRTLLSQLERWAAANDYIDPRPFPVRTMRRRGSAQPSNIPTGPEGPQYVPADARPDLDRIRVLRAAIERVHGNDGWWRALQLDIAAFSGLRLGETLALRSCHVDLDAGTLAVNWQYRAQPGTTAVLLRPKNNRVRTALLLPEVGRRLEPRLQPAGDGDAPACPDCQRWSCRILFPAPGGGPHNAANYRQRIAEPAFRATHQCGDVHLRWPKKPSGGWQWTWRSLRHHAATWHLDTLGLALADAAALLGHTPQVLMDRYYGATEGIVERATKAVRQLDAGPSA